MWVNETPAEGWDAFLAEAQQLMDADTPLLPALPIAPLVDSSFELTAEQYLDHLVATAPQDQSYLQIQADWDRFVTFGQFAEPSFASPAAAYLQLPSPSSRSLTPSPLIQTLAVAPPMERHVTGSPQVVSPTLYPPPILDVPSSPPAPCSPQPAFVEADRELLARSGVRQRTRRRVKEQPLHKTAEGREIIRLSGHVWYNAPSGFAVTQYPDTANWWRCNDVANYINWLDRGVRVHRSQICRVLAVENIEALNAVLTEEGYPAIVVKEAPHTFFPSLLGMGERQRDIPVFLRAGFADRNHPQRLRTRKRPHPPAP